MSRSSYLDILNDPTARVVTPEEAQALAERDARNRAAKAQATAERRANMGAARQRTVARKAALAPHIKALEALRPGQHYVMPAREFALAYRVANRCGFKIATARKPDDTMVVTREGSTAYEGLL